MDDTESDHSDRVCSRPGFEKTKILCQRTCSEAIQCLTNDERLRHLIDEETLVEAVGLLASKEVRLLL